MADSLVVRSKIKDFAKDMNVSSDFADALSDECKKMVEKAVKRAEANGRKTIQPRDL